MVYYSKIISHRDTRIIPSETVYSSSQAIEVTLTSSTSTLTLEERMHKMIEESLKKFQNMGNLNSDWCTIKRKDNGHEEGTVNHRLTISTENYTAWFLSEFGEQFSALDGQSFISPSRVSKITSRKKGWKKDPSSGRCFYFPIDGFSVINKGGDMLRGNRFRRYPQKYFAPPMIGSATLSELKTEYEAAVLIQEHSLRLQGRLTWAPRPIQLNNLTNYVLQSGEVVPFKDYLHQAKELEEVMGNIIHELMRAGIDPFDIPNEFRDKPFFWATEKFLETTGPHGNYLYSIQGFNTRIIDAVKLGGISRVKDIINHQYPEASSESEICTKFMQRIAEYRGITQGIGMTYLHGSDCLLVDTTLGGATVDIGDIALNPNPEAHLTSFLGAKSTCLYFYRLFKPDTKEDNPKFLALFEKDYVKTLMDYMRSGRNLVESTLRPHIDHCLNNLDSSIPRLMTSKTQKLRTSFVNLN